MKRYWIFPALALLLTGCAGQGTTAASSAAGSDAVQSTPSRPAGSAPVLDELPEGFEQVAAIGWCDFDRNGTEEEYKLSVRTDGDAYTVTIGGSERSGYMFTMEEEPYLVSLDGKTVQLAAFDYGPSDDPMVHFYGWDGKTAYEIGTIEAAPENITLEGGKIIAPVRWDVLQTSFFPLAYEMEDGLLVRVEEPEKWYTYCGGVGELTTAAELPLFAKDDLTSSASFTVPAGAAVEVTGVALDREIENPSEGDEPLYWVRIQETETGKTGYLLANGYQCRVPGSAPAAATDYLEGLTFAG